MYDIIYDILINNAYIFLTLKSKKLPKPLIKIIMNYDHRLMIADFLSYENRKMAPNFSFVPSSSRKYPYYYGNNIYYTDQVEFVGKHILVGSFSEMNVFIGKDFCCYGVHVFKFISENYSKKFLANYIRLLDYGSAFYILMSEIPYLSRASQKKFNKLINEKGAWYFRKYIQLKLAYYDLKQELETFTF